MAINWTGENEALYDLLYPLVVDAGIDGAAGGLSLVPLAEIDIDFALVNEAVRDWAQRYTFDLVTAINDTSRTFLRESLSAWTASGDPLSALTETLMPMFGPVRAEMIGVTEVTRAFAQGNIEAWRAAGVIEQMQWNTAEDSLVDNGDPSGPCNINSGQVVAIGDPFPSGDTEPPAHVRCILPGNEIVAPGFITGAAQSFYVGRCIEIRLASGRQLTVTQNHPILGRQGWISANLVSQGDQVACCANIEGVAACINPNDDNRPALIEQIFHSLEVSPLVTRRSVPIAAEDFYGDGQFIKGQINIIWPNGLLQSGWQSMLKQSALEIEFNRDSMGQGALFANGLSQTILERHGATSHGGVSSSNLGHALLESHVSPLESLSIGSTSGLNISLKQPAAKSPPIDSGHTRNFILRFTRDISFEQVVQVRQFDFSGHVYDLQVDPYGLYTCNGVIVKNCRCWLSPVIQETIT